MKNSDIYLNKEILNIVFPFYMAMDTNLYVVETGKGMRQRFPELIGKKWQEFFKIKRPFSVHLAYESLKEYTEHVFIIETLNKERIVFRGQVVFMQEVSMVLFIGSPWIASTEDLEKRNLLITDFALHDATPDMLQLMKSQEIVLNDMHNLTKTLHKQKDDLVASAAAIKKGETQLIVQNSISKALTGSLSFKTALMKIIKSICNNLGFISGTLWQPDEENELKCSVYWQLPELEIDYYENSLWNASFRKKQGLSSKVIKTKHTVWVPDISKDDHFAAMSEDQRTKLKSALAFPIIVNSEVIAVLEFFSAEIKEIDQSLLHIFEASGKQIGQFIIKTEYEEKIKESEERYKQLVEEASDIIYQTNAKGYFTFVNSVVLKVVDRREEEVLGKHFLELVRDDYKALAEKFYRDQFLNLVPLTYFEIPITNGQGQNVWIGQNVKLNIKDGRVLGSQAMARDITERKKWEHELMKAKEVAENSKRIKEQFLANMSHEIRTPMNAIIGMTDILRENKMTVEQKECLDAIKLSADNLLSIINDILDFSKIESGKVVFENRPFKLQDVLEGVIQTLHFTASKKSLALMYYVAENVPETLSGDTVRLRQILLNLASNSIKFTEKGSVKIDVSLKSSDLDSNCIQFKVSDTGIGIAEDKLDSIFESFTQATNDTTRKYGGTGLGLTIARQLIQQQGGAIKVESVINQGSDFIFSIRFKKNVEEVKTDVVNEMQYTFAELTGTKVLLVEDNVMNQLLAKKVLNKWNFVIDVADNGRIGVEKLALNEYDIVLLDMQMPEMDGYEAATHIRNNMGENKSKIPIMAMTAHAMVGEIEKCLSLGMNDYISKPFNQKQLYEKIMKLVKKQ